MGITIMVLQAACGMIIMLAKKIITIITLSSDNIFLESYLKYFLHVSLNDDEYSML